jgi:hypothetical protein
MEKTLRLVILSLQLGVGQGGGAPVLTAAAAVVPVGTHWRLVAKGRTGKATMATVVPQVGPTPVAVAVVLAVLRVIPPKQAARHTHQPTVGLASNPLSQAPQCGTPVVVVVVCRRITAVPVRVAEVGKVVVATAVETHQTVRPVQQTLVVVVEPAVRIEANRSVPTFFDVSILPRSVVLYQY